MREVIGTIWNWPSSPRWARRHVLAEVGQDEVDGGAAFSVSLFSPVAVSRALDNGAVRLVLAELVFEPGGHLVVIVAPAEHARRD